MELSEISPHLGVACQILDEDGKVLQATTENGTFIYDWYAGEFHLRIISGDTKRLEAISRIREQPFFNRKYNGYIKT